MKENITDVKQPKLNEKTLFGTIDKKIDVYVYKKSRNEFELKSYYRIKDLYDPMTGFDNVNPREGSKVFYDYVPYDRFKMFKPGEQVRISYISFRNNIRYKDESFKSQIKMNVLSVTKMENFNYIDKFKL